MSTADIGATLYVATAAPATNDAAGFAALTWVKVNGFQSIGELGIGHENIAVPDLQTGHRKGVKGASEGRDVPIVLRRVASDTGQGNVETAAKGRPGTLSVRVTYGTGTDQAPQTGDRVIYAQGYAHSWMQRERSDSSHEGFNCQFRQTEAEVTGTVPV